jgi:acetoin utilization deacetylase AcuC-like enzyme
MKLFLSPYHKLHATQDFPPFEGPAVLEQPKRIENIYEGLCRVTSPELETTLDFGDSVVGRVHPAEYIRFLSTAFEIERTHDSGHNWVIPENFPPKQVRYRSQHFNIRKGLHLTDTFTQIFAKTYQAAYWAAQASANAAEALTHGARLSYALVRPPGHHAYAEQAGGFCFLNNAAIAARQLQTHANYSRVAILDIDFHHGNGTQEIFYSDPSVFFCSIHGHPDFAYPYVSGHGSERGEGTGEGTNVNLCLERGADTSPYLAALELALSKIETYKPQALVLSLGFDIAQGDPYGGFEITPSGFREIGAILRAVNLPMAIIQEGGYRFDTLAENTEAFFSGLVA